MAKKVQMHTETRKVFAVERVLFYMVHGGRQKQLSDNNILYNTVVKLWCFLSHYYLNGL